MLPSVTGLKRMLLRCRFNAEPLTEPHGERARLMYVCDAEPCYLCALIAASFFLFHKGSLPLKLLANRALRLSTSQLS